MHREFHLGEISTGRNKTNDRRPSDMDENESCLKNVTSRSLEVRHVSLIATVPEAFDVIGGYHGSPAQ